MLSFIILYLSQLHKFIQHCSRSNRYNNNNLYFVQFSSSVDHYKITDYDTIFKQLEIILSCCAPLEVCGGSLGPLVDLLVPLHVTSSFTLLDYLNNLLTADITCT